MNSDKNELLISHLFDAPRDVVFNAWTDPEQLKHWYAPDGCSIELKRSMLRQTDTFITVYRIRYMVHVGSLEPISKSYQTRK